MGPRDLGHERRGPRIAVEQAALRGGPHQRLEFVLAMNVDEEAAHLAQQLQRHDLPVQIGA